MINTNFTTNRERSKQNNVNKHKLTPREVIELVKDSITLEAALDFYLGINLSAVKGRKTKLIHCPFHGVDNTPSFAVTPDKNLFHCFSCHRKGDVCTLASLVKNCSQARAAYLAAEDFGLLKKVDNQVKQSIQEKTADLELEQEFLKREKQALDFLIDFKRDIQASAKAKIKTLDDLAKFEKTYNKLLPRVDMFIDCFKEAEETPADNRVQNYFAAQEFIRDWIYPIIKSRLVGVIDYE